ncbi:hypothetical protein BDAP_002804 [Binucleata daphniae]
MQKLLQFSHINNQKPSLSVPFVDQYIAVPTLHSFKIYTHDLKCLFEGPYIENIKNIQIYTQNNSNNIHNDQSIFFTICQTPTHLYLVYRNKVCDAVNIEADNFCMVGSTIFLYKNKTIHEYKIELRSEKDKNNITSDDTKNGNIKSDSIKNNTIHATHCITHISTHIMSEDIQYVIHPKTYVNKILIAYKTSVEIYNYKKNKSVYKCMNIMEENKRDDHNVDVNITDESIVSLEDSYLLDHIAVATNKQIMIYNLKKDKKLFSIKISEEIKSVSFRSDDLRFLVFVTKNNNLYLLNIEERRICKKIENIYSACFIYKEPYIFVCEHSCIKIYKIENYNFIMHKQRMFVTESIKRIEPFCYRSDTMMKTDSVIVVTEERIDCNKENKKEGKYNIDKYDENNAGLHFIDLNHEELNFKFKNASLTNSDLSIKKRKILVSNKEEMILIDFETKKGKKILESYNEDVKNGFLSNCGEFLIFSDTQNIFVVNQRSKMIHNKIKINEKDTNVVCMSYEYCDNEMIVVYKNLIQKYKNKKESKIEFDEDIKNCKIIENFCILEFENKYVFYDYETEKVSREYDLTKIEPRIPNSSIADKNAITFCVSSDFRLFVTYKNNTLYIFDILTGKLIQTIENSKMFCMSFSYNDTFLCVCEDSYIRCLYNNLYFKNYILYKENVNNKYLQRKEDKNINLYTEMIKNGSFESYIANLDNVSLHKIFESLQEMIKCSFNEMQEILYKIFMLRKKDIDFDKIEGFYNVFVEELRNKEYERILGYVEYEKI